MWDLTKVVHVALFGIKVSWEKLPSYDLIKKVICTKVLKLLKVRKKLLLKVSVW